MKEINVKVIDPVGLHARPAAVAVSAASKFESEIRVHYNGKDVNLKSIMGVMSMGIPTKADIKITCEGPDEEAACTSIENILRAEKVIE